MMIIIRKIIKNNELFLLIILACLFVFFSFASKYFLQVSNIMLLMTQMVELGLLTMALSLSIISGGFDLSVASQASFYTVLFAIFIGKMALPVIPSALLVLFIAIFAASLSGILVGYFKVISMIATMGMQLIFSGAGMLITSGSAIIIDNQAFNFIGQYKIFGVIPFQIILFIIIIFLTSVALNRTITGRRIYLLGTNQVVARFAGINTKFYTLIVYTLAGVLAYFAGMIFAARLSSGRADVADSLLLQAIAASVLGGINVQGGSGKVIGAVLGVSIFATIANGLNMMRTSSFLQQVLVGVILLLVLTIRKILRSKT